VDGDTIVLNDVQKVRLIGVDTPETKHPNKPVEYFGKEATEFTKRLCEGKKVRLEYDWQKTDKYGRTLAYVFVLENGKEIFLNAEIIKRGYGYAYLKYPFKDEYMRAFREYERQAREEGLGLWAE
jgi:micrococcal nuclease